MANTPATKTTMAETATQTAAPTATTSRILVYIRKIMRGQDDALSLVAPSVVDASLVIVEMVVNAPREA